MGRKTRDELGSIQVSIHYDIQRIKSRWLHTSSFEPDVGSFCLEHSERSPARSRGRFIAGRSEVRRDEKVAGPVIWRPRDCLLPAAMALRARDDALEACMVDCLGW